MDTRLLHRRAGHGARVAALSSDEYRVWTQYLLSADDFGVMPYSAVRLAADNLFFGAAKVLPRVQGWLDGVVKSGLVRVFSHHGERYLYQPDWQTWQKVRYPSRTLWPAPSAEALALCDAATQELFSIHPGGQKHSRKSSEDVPKVGRDYSGTARAKSSETVPNNSRLRGKQLTAITNANADPETPDARATATDDEPPFAGQGPLPAGPPLDRWFREFAAAYPAFRRRAGQRIESLFCGLFFADRRPAADVWAEVMANLAANVASDEWRRGLVPSMATYLEDGLWRNRLPSPEEVAQAAKASAPTRSAGWLDGPVAASTRSGEAS